MLNRTLIILLAFLTFVSGCKNETANSREIAPAALRNVPAQRLNYRFETDIPAPEAKAGPGQSDERNPAVQADFDNSRVQENLDRTITSPDKQRVLAVYRKIEDLATEFRLDVYSADGKLIKKVTHDEMAVHFPGTIVWSPDSKNVAFLAMVRGTDTESSAEKNEGNATKTEAPPETETEDSNTSDAAAETSNANSESASDDPSEPAKDVLTFRTEQIYLCGADGEDLKPLTQNEGLMYFYAVWAPDSSALVALASPFTEWRVREFQMTKAGERFVPMGRPRLIEKNGRERLLDDYPTQVHPVWSPDSAKVAIAIDKQIRIYDAIGEAPTQAAIPLRNRFLLAAKAYEDKLRAEEEGGGSNSNSPDSNANSTDQNANGANINSNVEEDPNAPTTTLPDASKLVAFNPIINLNWELDSMLYIETGYVKNYVDNETENRRSYLRWHRLIFSPQAIAIEGAAQ
ncbi:MAG: hypothetical protein R2681_08365 [Pyrinomonadaceae bacterium]